jgi:hypothetical protein
MSQLTATVNFSTILLILCLTHHYNKRKTFTQKSVKLMNSFCRYKEVGYFAQKGQNGKKEVYRV